MILSVENPFFFVNCCESIQSLVFKTFYLNEYFQDLKINLIMTDYSMPGMTGYELMKKIKVSLPIPLFF